MEQLVDVFPETVQLGSIRIDRLVDVLFRVVLGPELDGHPRSMHLDSQLQLLAEVPDDGSKPLLCNIPDGIVFEVAKLVPILDCEWEELAQSENLQAVCALLHLLA